MAGPASILREVHRLRVLARELQEQLDYGPRQLKARQTKVARQETLLKEETEAIKKIKVSTHEKEVSIKTTQAQIVKYTKQLAEAAGKKEYDALQNEIATAKARISQLEDDALAQLGEAEERTAKLPEMEKNLKASRAELAEFQKGAAERTASLTTHMEETKAQLKTVEATLPNDVRPQFNRVVAGMGADGFAVVNDRTCAACHTGLTAQHYTDLVQELFVLCKSCGRILYPPANLPTPGARVHDDKGDLA